MLVERVNIYTWGRNILSGCSTAVVYTHGGSSFLSGRSIVVVRKAGGLVVGVRFSPAR